MTLNCRALKYNLEETDNETVDSYSGYDQVPTSFCYITRNFASFCAFERKPISKSAGAWQSLPESFTKTPSEIVTPTSFSLFT